MYSGSANSWGQPTPTPYQPKAPPAMMPGHPAYPPINPAVGLPPGFVPAPVRPAIAAYPPAQFAYPSYASVPCASIKPATQAYPAMPVHNPVFQPSFVPQPGRFTGKGGFGGKGRGNFGKGGFGGSTANAANAIPLGRERNWGRDEVEETVKDAASPVHRPVQVVGRGRALTIPAWAQKAAPGESKAMGASLHAEPITKPRPSGFEQCGHLNEQQDRKIDSSGGRDISRTSEDVRHNTEREDLGSMLERSHESEVGVVSRSKHTEERDTHAHRREERDTRSTGDRSRRVEERDTHVTGDRLHREDERSRSGKESDMRETRRDYGRSRRERSRSYHRSSRRRSPSEQRYSRRRSPSERRTSRRSSPSDRSRRDSRR